MQDTNNPLLNIDNSLLDKLRDIQDLSLYNSNSTIRIWLNEITEHYVTHWHPDIEIIIPLIHEYTVIIGQNTYTLAPGEIFLIPPGEPHELLAPPNGVRLIVMFDFSVFSKISSFSYITAYLSKPVLINRDCFTIYQQTTSLLTELLYDYCSDNVLREFPIYSKLITFFALYGEYRISSERFEDSILHDAKESRILDRLNAAFRFLDEHYSEDITLEQAADVAGFSKFYFSRLFKQYSEHNFYEYLCFRRIKAAEMLLLRPDISVTEVALQSGFSSLSTFNRVFKKLKKCTPSEYRKLYISQLSRANESPENHT